jgi:hypothetical protein
MSAGFSIKSTICNVNEKKIIENYQIVADYRISEKAITGK